MNVPRHLPFKIGKIKEAACGGTGNAVLTGEFAFTFILFSASPCCKWIVASWSMHFFFYWKQKNTVFYEERWETAKSVI